MLISLPIFCSLAAPAPVSVFEPGPSVLTPAMQAWHPEHEANGDYGESWFSVTQTEGGGLLFAMLSITNLGLRTFDGLIDLQWYPPEGGPQYLHRELPRARIDAATDHLDTRIGPGRIRATQIPAHTATGLEHGYQLTVADGDWSLDLRFTNRLPAVQFGGGRLWFYADRRSHWSMGMLAPRAQTTGALRIGSRTWDLAGDGYLDHSWSTIKVPTMINRWLTLRVFDPNLTLVLNRLSLQPAFGGGDMLFGVLGRRDEALGRLRSFSYQPLAWRTDETSGMRVPTKLSVAVEANGWKVRGEVREARFLDAIDVLAQISWPIRVAIKAFYSEPYLVRLLGNYELDVTDPGGATTHVSGLTLVEVDYY